MRFKPLKELPECYGMFEACSVNESCALEIECCYFEKSIKRLKKKKGEI